MQVGFMDRIKVFVTAMLLCSLTAGAQQDSVQVVKEKAKPIFGITLVNQYIWRGLDEGNVCVQPTVGVSYKGLSFSAWGSVGFQRDDLKEFDLLLSYTTHGFNVGITDYWFGQGRYFLYTNNETTHVFEANVGYDFFGYVSFQWYTNFAGNDGSNNSGHKAYSSYFEFSAPFRVLTLDWKAAVGFVPYATSFYSTRGFAVTNVSLTATKDFLICKKYHLPVFIGLTANPHAEKMYILCGASFTL